MSTNWPAESVCEIGAGLALSHPFVVNEILPAIDTSLSAVLSDLMLMRIAGRVVLDSPDVVDSVADPAEFEQAITSRLRILPDCLRSVVPKWGLQTLNNDAKSLGRTYRRNRRIAELNGLDAAAAALGQELGKTLGGGGGAAMVLSAIRELNLGSDHLRNRSDILLGGLLGPDPSADDLLWISYLIERDLFTLGERLGAPATACAEGECKVFILNARGGLLLDQAETFADGGAVGLARGLVVDAWTTLPTKATRNVQARLARLSRNREDLRILEVMNGFLGEG